MFKHLLRSVFFVGIITAVCGAQSLRQAADSAGLLVGTAVRPSLLSETAYAKTLAGEFNMVEPEDAMKWPALRPDAASFDFRRGDELVRFAQAHQMKVRGHCLVWDHDNPDWLTTKRYTTRQLSRILQEHITRVMGHYAGQVFAWDVINEATDENGRVRNSIWYNQPGIGFSRRGSAYIEQVFRWAHKADPRALLFYNEAEGEGLNRKSDAIYAMMQEFERRRVPIDGVGLQLHVPAIEVDTASMAAGVLANIARLTALGLQVHITELDVPLPVEPDGSVRPHDLARQAEIYRSIVRACLNNAGCTAIQTWGFTDKYSWIGSHSKHTLGAALPFDRDHRPKAAHRAILEELSAGRPRRIDH